MTILLYGKDTYRLKQSLQKIIDEYKKKHTSGMSFLSLDLGVEGKEGMRKLEDSIKTISFFDEKKLIILRETFAQSKEIADLIITWKLVEDKNIILVFAESGTQSELVRNDKKLFSILSGKAGMVKTFEFLNDLPLENWIQKELEQLEAKIEPTAIKKLIEYIGNDSWRIHEELVKLANHNGKKAITADDVVLLVNPRVDLNIFEMLDALAVRNRAKSAQLLNKHLAAGDDEYYIFSMMVYLFRNLLRIKHLLMGQTVPTAEAIVKKTGLHPFAVKKMIDQSRRFEWHELKDRFHKLAEADIKIKSGQFDITDFLYSVALS
mgnify:CR=1 FL=1